MNYTPDIKSVSKHEVPGWFHDAKLGIFIHWGLYSVPAFAVTGIDINELIKKEGFAGNFKKNPYAEWYLNSLRIPNTPTQKYHLKTYGKDFSYDDFVPLFNEAVKKWSPIEMADLFKKAGARYVVLVTKHHDGFLLWHSKYPNPRKKNYVASRDIAGELAGAVKNNGMKMGFYYSGALDWSFTRAPIKDITGLISNGPVEKEYIDYVNNHWYELIDKYDPVILWNDIGYPPGTNINEIFAYFYNKFPNGVVNDRWSQFTKGIRRIVKIWPISRLINWLAKRAVEKGGANLPIKFHHDFNTPEYSHFDKIIQKKWECTRGLGNSFGYNKQETDDDYLTPEDLIRMFVDIVSKNGNLLLNVGPMADGSIPEFQKKCLMGLGKWLDVNGDAIFGTRPWTRAGSETMEGIEVRFIQKQNVLFAIILDKPKTNRITIKNLTIEKNSIISMLGHEGNLTFVQEENDLKISIPENLEFSPAYSLKIKPVPLN